MRYFKRHDLNRFNPFEAPVVKGTDTNKPYIMENRYCGRCGGCGVWGRGTPRAGTCYGCGGCGHRGLEKVRVFTDERLTQLENIAAKKLVKKQAKAEEAARAKAEEVARTHDAFSKAYPRVLAFLETMPGDFAESLRESVATRGKLSDAQIAAVEKNMAQAAEPKTPVVEGRHVIEGVILSTKTVLSDYGPQYKMLVKDDRGFKVFGTIPRSLNVTTGDRVSLTATCKASNDDKYFGFYSRPSKASCENVNAPANVL